MTNASNTFDWGAPSQARVRTCAVRLDHAASDEQLDEAVDCIGHSLYVVFLGDNWGYTAAVGSLATSDPFVHLGEADLVRAHATVTRS
jgi:hypothetical protein